MATQKKDKLKILFRELVPGNVVISPWLEEKGISRSLQKHYLKNGWLEPFGRGAYKRPDDIISWQNVVSTLQNQLNLPIHVGANSALNLQGFSHYLRFDNEKLFLFTPHKKNLPKWFTDAEWDMEIHHKQTGFLPFNIGLVTHEIQNANISISTAERAFLECLYLAPKYLDLTECYKLLEGLVNLMPKLLSDLLKNCSSVQVKRLFLYMAEKANHQWLKYLETEEIDLGKGNRMLCKNGVYIARYQLSVPKELVEL